MRVCVLLQVAAGLLSDIDIDALMPQKLIQAVRAMHQPQCIMGKYEGSLDPRGETPDFADDSHLSLLCAAAKTPSRMERMENTE